MKRILIANEFGGGRGHTDATRCLLQAIGDRAEVQVIAQPMVAQQLSGATALPAWPDPKPFEASDLWETLDKIGTWRPENLRPRIAAYRRALDELTPDLVIGDYAPLAMLMARSLGCQTIAVGSPFFTPDSLGRSCRVPDGHPTRWSAEEAEGATAVLRLLGIRLDEPVETAIAGQSQWVRSLPALDPLGGQPNRLLVKPDLPIEGEDPRWSSGRARIACYLRPANKRIPVIDALVDQIEGAVICSSGSSTEIGRWGQRVHVNPAGFNPEPLLREADILIHNGGAGLCKLAALAGTPQVSLPNNQEQLLNATLTQNRGWGSVHTGGLLRLIRRVRAGLSVRIPNPPSDPSLSLVDCVRSELCSHPSTTDDVGVGCLDARLERSCD